MNKSKDRGFTLIELLVVIAIIAILAAILFPVFAKAREKARQVSCLSNMNQLGLGIMQYVQDYDEMYPGTAYYGEGWAELVFPYVKSTGVFSCPDDVTQPQSWQVGWTTQVSYVANSWVIDYKNTQNNGAASMAQLIAPASTVLLFEGNHIYAGYNGPGTPASAIINSWQDGYTDFYLSPPSLYYTLVGDGSASYYSVPIDITRHHQMDGPDATGITRSGWLNFLGADGHAKYLDASWCNQGGVVSVGGMNPPNPPMWPYEARGQNELSEVINGQGPYTMSFNPGP